MKSTSVNNTIDIEVTIINLSSLKPTNADNQELCRCGINSIVYQDVDGGY